MRRRRAALSVLVLALAHAAPPAAPAPPPPPPPPPSLRVQAPTPEQQLAQALAVLAATETERGVELLRELLATLPAAAAPPVRVQAEWHLAAASWALGLFDSAATHFQEAARLDPFIELDREVFNPSLVTVFHAAKRTAIAVGLRAPRDTALEPKSDRWPVRIAVTQPGRVQLHLAGPGAPAGRDSVLATLTIDSTSTVAVPLNGSDGQPLAPGAYRLYAEYSGPWRLAVQATLRLELSRQAADTAPHGAAPPDSLLRPEHRLGPPSRPSLLRGLGFGALAGAIPLIFGNSRLGENSFQAKAVAVGAAVGVAGLIGAFTARPKHPVPDNVAHNRALRASWQDRDQAIASANEARRRVTLLRVRVLADR